MTKWLASPGDIFDVEADALVCSANPQLNLSGGVGGEFRLRYGDEMQRFLHDWLRQHGLRHVLPETVVAAPACGSPYRTVLHAVAIDVFYDSSVEIITQTCRRAFELAAQAGCRTVVSACPACGYGRATPAQFGEAVRTFAATDITGLDRVEFRSRDHDVIDEILQAWQSEP